jgi:hypothetical protein
MLLRQSNLLVADRVASTTKYYVFVSSDQFEAAQAQSVSNH